jgi:GH15 family glucan-1,4-alpha-glucosidase
MTDLVERSIKIILQYQSTTGAYPACPTFPTYQYSWFRDGAFIAYAMDLVGEHESASHFFEWSASVINAREELIYRAIEVARSGAAIERGEILHTRYTLDGDEAIDEWQNFQLDGFGTLLWAMGRHVELTQTPPPESWTQSISLVAAYLSALWRTPCFDCWEEFPDEIHPHTLAAIHAGLTASQALIDQDHRVTLRDITDFLLREAVVDGHFVKFCGTENVDASLLGLAIPYRVFALDDSRIQNAIELIEDRLWKGGGVHRYGTDTYYGGGEWVLLAAWLAWYYALRGDRPVALELKEWIEAQANDSGYLPEQVPETLNDPTMYQPWVDRWGEIAQPLLWSHAKYLILLESLKT